MEVDKWQEWQGRDETPGPSDRGSHSYARSKSLCLRPPAARVPFVTQGGEVSRTVVSVSLMPLTTEQLMTTMGLVDEIIDCSAQLHGSLNSQRRRQLESAMAVRSAMIKGYLGSAELW